MDTTHEVQLLEALSDIEPSGCPRYAIRQYPTKARPFYDVLEYLSGEDESHQASIIIDNQPVSVQPTLANALAHIASQGQSKRLWIESLCLERQSVSKSTERSRMLKQFRMNAETVLIWIGKDEETDDVLTDYLGPGTSLSTDAAFSI